MNKILNEIKREDEEKPKSKKGKDTHFLKLLDKIKKISRTTYNYNDADKIYTMLKNLNDLIQTYIKDSD